jgi:hypothetical protein
MPRTVVPLAVPPALPRRRFLAAAKLVLLSAAIAASLLGFYRLLDSTALDVLRYRFSFWPVVLVLLALNLAVVAGGMAMHFAWRSIRRDWSGGGDEADTERAL